MFKFLLLGILISTSACSWHNRDGAPPQFPDVSAIADAKPYAEPTSRGGNAASYVVNGKRYSTLKDRRGFSQTGIASWYGTKFHGRLTSNGERYDMYKMTAAHKTLPIPTYVKVTNLENNKAIMVRINDRGPFVGDRIIDLSYVAAIKLGMTKEGTARVHVEAWSAEKPPMVRSPSLAPKATVVSIDTPLVGDSQRRYYLQLGAFANQRNAQKMRSRLLSITEEPVKVSIAQTVFGDMYRVRVGPYGREEVALVEKNLSQLGFKQQTIIVSESFTAN